MADLRCGAQPYEDRSCSRLNRPGVKNRVLASITSASFGRRRSFRSSTRPRCVGGSTGGSRRSATADSDRTMRSISFVQSVRETGVASS
jgi:hypothetical protein